MFCVPRRFFRRLAVHAFVSFTHVHTQFKLVWAYLTFLYLCLFQRNRLHPTFRIHRRSAAQPNDSDARVFPDIGREEEGPFLLQWKLYNWKTGDYFTTMQEILTRDKLQLPSFFDSQFHFPPKQMASVYDMQRSYLWTCAADKTTISVAKLADEHIPEQIFAAFQAKIPLATLLQYGVVHVEQLRFQNEKQNETMKHNDQKDNNDDDDNDNDEENDDVKEAVQAVQSFLNKHNHMAGFTILPYSTRHPPITVV